MESYCVNCGEPFDPIEGNSDREFCSYECEEAHYDRCDNPPEDDAAIAAYINSEHYNYGRNPMNEPKYTGQVIINTGQNGKGTVLTPEELQALFDDNTDHYNYGRK